MATVHIAAVPVQYLGIMDKFARDNLESRIDVDLPQQPEIRVGRSDPLNAPLMHIDRHKQEIEAELCFQIPK